MNLFYFGTTFSRASGHFYYNIENGKFRDCEFSYRNNPGFSPEAIQLKKGEYRIENTGDYTALIIGGSCSDDRGNTFTCFFVDEIVSIRQLVSKIKSNALAVKILENLDFKINSRGDISIERLNQRRHYSSTRLSEHLEKFKKFSKEIQPDSWDDMIHIAREMEDSMNQTNQGIKVTTAIMDFVNSVIEQRRPLMTKIVLDVGNEVVPIVSLWAMVGHTSIHNRIEMLVKENSEMINLLGEIVDEIDMRKMHAVPMLSGGTISKIKAELKKYTRPMPEKYEDLDN